MKLIIDTNIIFSALYEPDSTAGDLMDRAIDGEIQLFAPQRVWEELIQILSEKLDYGDEYLMELYQGLPVKWIEEDIYGPEIKRAEKYIDNKKDAPILACAITTGFDIITRDRHFKALKGLDIETLSLKYIIKRK